MSEGIRSVVVLNPLQRPYLLFLKYYHNKNLLTRSIWLFGLRILYTFVSMYCFVRDVGVFKGRLLGPDTWYLTQTCSSISFTDPSARCRKLRKNFFLCTHRWVARMYMMIFNANYRLKGVRCLNQDKVAKQLVKVPVYFQSPTRISKAFQIVFVLSTGNMYFLKKILNGVWWKYYNIEILGINILHEGQPARKSAIMPK